MAGSKKICLRGWATRLRGAAWRKAKPADTVKMTGQCGTAVGTRKIDGFRTLVVRLPSGRHVAVFGVPGVANRK